MKRWSIFCLTALVLPCKLSAQPVLEAYDRFEMNWSTMRLRYFGESVAGKTLDAAEKEATDQGLLYALANVPKIRGEKGVSVDNAGDIAKTVSKQSFVFNTIYFSNGKVRIELESSLALALDPGRKPFLENSTDTGADGSPPGSEGGTGLVLEVKGLKSPAPLSEVFDSAGNLVFSSQDISPDVYRKQLIGRWFYKGSSELNAFAGAQPLRVEAEFRDGKLIVDKEMWNEARKSMPQKLSVGRVAFALPVLR